MGFFAGMKQSQKKLVGVTVIGLSAWLLVIGLVLFDQTTKAMLTGDPVPSAESSPNVLGAETSIPNTAQITTVSQGDADMHSILLAGGAAIVCSTSIAAVMSIRQYKKRTSKHPS